ncbi:unnamed protein product [Urochloa humidicola]
MVASLEGRARRRAAAEVPGGRVATVLWSRDGQARGASHRPPVRSGYKSRCPAGVRRKACANACPGRLVAETVGCLSVVRRNAQEGWAVLRSLDGVLLQFKSIF